VRCGRVLVHAPGGAIVARYGGEEFRGPAAGDEPGSLAAVLAEQMRSSVQDMAIYHERSPFDQRQTVSLGVATVSPGPVAADPDQLVSMADRALYQAKQSGRNRVVVSMPLRLPNAGELCRFRTDTDS